MINLSFTTQPLISTSQYQIVDTSTNRSGYDYKQIIIYAQDNITKLYEESSASINTDVFSISTSGWGLLGGLLQISVYIGYVIIGNSPDALQKFYLLPTTLNIQS